MYRSLLPSNGDLFAQFDRMQQEMNKVFGGLDVPSSIRSVAAGSFPPVNVGTTPKTVEIYAFAPGLDADKLDISIDWGVLTITGERGSAWTSDDAKTSIYAAERFSGSFQRTFSLPDDVDPDSAEAKYVDGVLKIVLQRPEAAQPKRITVQ